MPVIIALIVACMVICFAVAKHRNARSIYWAFMGMLLGPFAIPFVFFAKPIVSESDQH